MVSIIIINEGFTEASGTYRLVYIFLIPILVFIIPVLCFIYLGREGIVIYGFMIELYLTTDLILFSLSTYYEGRKGLSEIINLLSYVFQPLFYQWYSYISLYY